MSRDELYEKLKNPPIAEAALELKYDNLNIETLKIIKDVLEKEYKLSFSELRTKQLSFNAETEKVDVSPSDIIGYQFKDENNAIQIKNNSSLFSRIGKYESFDDIKKYFDSLINIGKNIRLKRIGVRYINQFSISKEKLKPDLVCLTMFNKDISKPLQNYRREVFKMGSIDVILANVLDFVDYSRVNVVLDIDVSYSFENGEEINKASDKIFELKSLKNEVFYEYVKSFREIFD